MRLLFLLLLLANIAFFAWHDRITEWISPRTQEERPAAQADSGGPAIVLLSEHDRSKAAPQSSSPGSIQEGTTPAITASHCTLASPFTDRAIADQARADAVAAGLIASIEQGERDIIVSYLLLMPERYGTAEQAETATQALLAKGVTDIAAVPIGNQFAVSLGIYNRPRAMEKRRQEAIAAGFTPDVRERRAHQTVYSVLVGYGAADGDRLADVRKSVSLLDPQIEWQQASCQ